ncbi:hypothetical protein HK100_007360 [Physocladia obscura]|uniref:Uncharacterized protein n=1 Tax=Physocladia obscura TaxID=109957 RepID=A0AAD5SQH1_9FUNG|nr:hypothetical protein HK100_007360 [Physocladia obscura]
MANLALFFTAYGIDVNCEDPSAEGWLTALQQGCRKTARCILDKNNIRNLTNFWKDLWKEVPDDVRSHPWYSSIYDLETNRFHEFNRGMISIEDFEYLNNFKIAMYDVVPIQEFFLDMYGPSEYQINFMESLEDLRVAINPKRLPMTEPLCTELLERIAKAIKVAWQFENAPEWNIIMKETTIFDAAEKLNQRQAPPEMTASVFELKDWFTSKLNEKIAETLEVESIQLDGKNVSGDVNIQRIAELERELYDIELQIKTFEESHVSELATLLNERDVIFEAFIAKVGLKREMLAISEHVVEIHEKAFQKLEPFLERLPSSFPTLLQVCENIGRNVVLKRIEVVSVLCAGSIVSPYLSAMVRLLGQDGVNKIVKSISNNFRQNSVPSFSVTVLSNADSVELIDSTEKKKFEQCLQATGQVIIGKEWKQFIEVMCLFVKGGSLMEVINHDKLRWQWEVQWQLEARKAEYFNTIVSPAGIPTVFPSLVELSSDGASFFKCLRKGLIGQEKSLRL